MRQDHSIIRYHSFNLSHNMFKLRAMSSNNQTPCNNSWPSLNFRKEESKEDSARDSRDKEEASVDEEY